MLEIGLTWRLGTPMEPDWPVADGHTIEIDGVSRVRIVHHVDHSADPDDWKIVFPDLCSYRDSWPAASSEFRAKQFAMHSHLEALLARTHLGEIDISGDRALAHKKFYGDVHLADGSQLADRRQTLFRLHRRNGMWKIVGFFGQLPLYSE